MCEVAAHLTDHVLPHVPARQWVLSVPKRLRPYLHHDVRVAGAVLQIFLRAIRATLRRSSPTASSRAQLGAVSFFHQFFAARPRAQVFTSESLTRLRLVPTPSFKCSALLSTSTPITTSSSSMASSARPTTVRSEFHEAHDLTPDRIAQVESVVQKRVLRYFRRQGLLDELDAAGMPGTRRRRVGQGSGGFFALRAQVPSAFSVDASVRIEAEDRAGIERLVRYCARPPFALERLNALGSTPSLASPESRLVYRFPKPDIHGRTELLLTPLELLEALAKFVPPPRVHRHRYHGVLAPNARLRPHVVAFGRPELVSEQPATEGDVASPSPAAEPAPAPASPARIRWAVLLARIYNVLPLLCPACGAEMRILAFLTDPPVVSAILLHLDLPLGPPPLSPARGPPQSDLLTGLLDQTPAFDPAEPEPIPDLPALRSGEPAVYRVALRHRRRPPGSSSTSPRPTTSISEAPQAGRPAGDSPPSAFPAHPRIPEARSGLLSSRGSLAASWRLQRPRAARLRCPPTSPPAPSYLAHCQLRPFGVPIVWSSYPYMTAQ